MQEPLVVVGAIPGLSQSLKPAQRVAGNAAWIVRVSVLLADKHCRMSIAALLLRIVRDHISRFEDAASDYFLSLLLGGLQRQRLCLAAFDHGFCQLIRPRRFGQVDSLFDQTTAN